MYDKIFFYFQESEIIPHQQISDILMQVEKINCLFWVFVLISWNDKQNHSA